MSPLSSWKGMQQTKETKPFEKGAFLPLKLGLAMNSWMIVIYIQTEQIWTPQCSDKHFNNYNQLIYQYPCQDGATPPLSQIVCRHFLLNKTMKTKKSFFQKIKGS